MHILNFAILLMIASNVPMLGVGATDDSRSTTITPRFVINLPTFLPEPKTRSTLPTVLPLVTTSKTAKKSSASVTRSPVKITAKEVTKPPVKTVLTAVNQAPVKPTSTTKAVAAIKEIKPKATTAKPITQSPKRAIATSVGNTKTTPAPNKSTISSNVKSNKLPDTDKPAKPNPAKSVGGTAPTDLYECPKDESFQLFPTFCSRHGECMRRSGDEFRCCKQFGTKRCVKAAARPIPEPKHEPILGFIPRKCPREPLAELFWDLQTCDTDRDCWPRVCCPDGIRKYCRTAQPELEKSSYSVARQLSTPIESITKYIQCTPPPSAIYDQFPKKCNSTWDCFPNVCCQEAGRKHCRPPKRSLLALLTGVATRFNTGLIRQWTQNLVIR